MGGAKNLFILKPFFQENMKSVMYLILLILATVALNVARAEEDGAKERATFCSDGVCFATPIRCKFNSLGEKRCVGRRRRSAVGLKHNGDQRSRRAVACNNGVCTTSRPYCKVGAGGVTCVGK